jgi:hypothetical protein
VNGYPLPIEHEIDSEFSGLDLAKQALFTSPVGVTQRP